MEPSTAFAAGTDVGRKYPANFDVLHAAADLLVVADGMGGTEGSRVAGRTAVDTFLEGVRGRPPGPETYRAAVAEAQLRVNAEGRRLGELAGCTLTALAVDGDRAWIVHIGDSRVYRLRGGVLELLTVDHTMAWLGAVNGWYAADSPEAAAARYHLLRYVGHPDHPEPDILNVTLRPGDRYCVCTDGVAEQVPYQRLAEILGSPTRPAQMIAAMLSDTVAAGGRDNATAAILAA